MVGAVDAEDVARDLLVERPVGHAEELGDLAAGEREALGAQEELAGLALEHDVAEGHRGEPRAVRRERAHDVVEAIAAQVRVAVVEGRELEFGY